MIKILRLSINLNGGFKIYSRWPFNKHSQNPELFQSCQIEKGFSRKWILKTDKLQSIIIKILYAEIQNVKYIFQDLSNLRNFKNRKDLPRSHPDQFG